MVATEENMRSAELLRGVRLLLMRLRAPGGEAVVVNKVRG
jgi:hypothetical protein